MTDKPVATFYDLFTVASAMADGKHSISNFSVDGDECTCGCYGKDPWHKNLHKLVIRKKRGRYSRTTSANIGLNSHVRFVADGVAKFPWGESRVVLAVMHEGTPNQYVSWCVDAEDEYRAKHGE